MTSCMRSLKIKQCVTRIYVQSRYLSVSSRQPCQSLGATYAERAINSSSVTDGPSGTISLDCVRRAVAHSSSTARAAAQRPDWYARKPSLKRSRKASFTAHVLHTINPVLLQ